MGCGCGCGGGGVVFWLEGIVGEAGCFVCRGVVVIPMVVRLVGV